MEVHGSAPGSEAALGTNEIRGAMLFVGSGRAGGEAFSGERVDAFVERTGRVGGARVAQGRRTQRRGLGTDFPQAGSRCTRSTAFDTAQGAARDGGNAGGLVSERIAAV